MKLCSDRRRRVAPGSASRRGRGRGRVRDRARARARIQKVSQAADARVYRLDAARHIYDVYSNRIYRGRLPPLIHAVVVVETTVDERGTAARREGRARPIARARRDPCGGRDDPSRRPAAAARRHRGQRQVHGDLARPQGRPVPARRPDRRAGLTVARLARAGTGESSGRPAKCASRLPNARSAIAWRVCQVALPTCGVRTTLSSASSSAGTFGSFSNTSRAAPAIVAALERLAPAPARRRPSRARR